MSRRSTSVAILALKYAFAKRQYTLALAVFGVFAVMLALLAVSFPAFPSFWIHSNHFFVVISALVLLIYTPSPAAGESKHST